MPQVPVRRYVRRLAKSASFVRRDPLHKIGTIRHSGQKRLQPYLKYSMGDYHRFEEVPVSLAKQLLTGYPLVDPEQTQNDGPTMQQMVELAEKHDGTLEGYVIDETREDARVTFDGFTLKVEGAKARDLQKALGVFAREADEFTKDAKGYRFWWD